jgi:hypothetical protein
MSCTYKKNSVEPCDNCPKLITSLYSCKLLQENIDENYLDSYGVTKSEFKTFSEFKIPVCKHENIKSSDGLDECLDCGASNY